MSVSNIGMLPLELGTSQAELGAIDQFDPSGFTLVEVTGQYLINQQPASGTVTFTLTEPLTSGGLTIPAAPLVVTLDATGSLAVYLVATDNPDTTPTGAWYGVTEQIVGAQPRDYFIQVSATGPNPLLLSPPGVLPWQ